MLCFARGKHGSSQLAADVQALPFRDDAFAGIVSSFLMHWVPDRRRALCEAKRCLRPGGAIWMGTPVAGSFEEFHQLITERIDPGDSGFTPFVFPKPDDVEADVRRTGFDCVERIGVEEFGIEPGDGLEALRFMRYAGAGSRLGADVMRHAPSFPVRLAKRWRPTPLMFRILFIRAVK
jgi:SAM-dependent methyltransferase